MSEQTKPVPEDETSEQMQVRKAKRQALIDKGVSPYPVELPITTTIAEIREKFEGLEAGVELTTLSNYQDLIGVAVAGGYITSRDISTLQEWRKDPASWGVAR